MSLMNYLGAVASAAVEAATAAAIQGQTASNIPAGQSTTLGEDSSGASSTNSCGNAETTTCRTNVTVAPTLSGFPVMPITIHHSSGLNGQFAYAVQTIPNGTVRLAHPSVSSNGQPRTFTVHPAGGALSGQVPTHFSLTGSPRNLEFRLPPPPILSSQLSTSVGSQLDNQRGILKLGTLRGPSIPVSISQTNRVIECEFRRDTLADSIPLKAPFTNLSAPRLSVLTTSQSNTNHEFIPLTDPKTVLSIILQDHNYTLPKRDPPTQTPPAFPSPSEVTTPPVPVSNEPPSHVNKIHISPPVLPKTPLVQVSTRLPSPPTSGKPHRPKSFSPAAVPGRRRKKDLEKKALAKKHKQFDDLARKTGVLGRKRSRKQAELSALSSTIPPFPVETSEHVRTHITSKPVCRSPPSEAEMLSKINKFKQICEIYEDTLKESTNKPDEVAERQPEILPAADPEEVEEENKAPEPSNNLSSTFEDSNNEGITRCICDYLHDDGFMIACDNCNVWQHVDCMGIDRAALPDNYLCVLCNPRWVSKARARAIQTRKKELLELGVVEDTSLVERDQDKVDKSLEILRPNSLELSDEILSPGKISGKIKRRGRPSLSNGQPFSDSDSEIASGLLSPTPKRHRKHSGKKGQNLSVPDESPSKIGSRKRKSLEPKIKKRSYTRRNTITSPLSSPVSDDSKSVDEHKENSATNCSDTSYLLEDSQIDDASSRNSNSQIGFEDQPKSDESFTKDVGDTNGMLANSESRRKRKQIFRDIPNGDLSPPHIIASNPATLDKQSVFKSRSPSFDKPPNGPILSNASTESFSPDPTPSAVSSLQISLSSSSFTSTLLCPYSSSPYLDKFEEAVNSVCSYSPELRAKLLKNLGLGNNSVPDFTPLSENVKKWKMGVTSLEGGKKLKTLLAGVRVEPGEAIIEFIGKFMMHTAFIPTSKKTTQLNSNMISPEPFVFFHQVPKNGMCICIDCRKYGNDARFVRRSCTSNAEIRHVVGKGTIHAYVVATEVINVDDEVTISHEFKSVTHNTMNSVVHKYHVVPPPLPCACSDLETCKAVVQDPVVGEVVHKKNGALISPTIISPESKERKRRMSSRRTSLLEKEVSEIQKPVQVPTPPLQSPIEHEPPQEPVKILSPATPLEEEWSEVSPVSVNNSVGKERGDGRATRARTVTTVIEETPSPPPPLQVLKKKVENPGPSRQRNRSGMDPTSILPPHEPLVESHVHVSHVETHKMTREERKLQSVLKIIERMESNQKKKESRQNQKKDKREKKVEEREIDGEDDILPPPHQPSLVVTPVKFTPSNKRKGRKRGRSSSKPGGKPQMISQRKSGSIADIRSTSTESDFNSADEAAKAGMSPLQENMGPNFRLPKKKEMMSEWRIGFNHNISPSLPSQYMRKSNLNTGFSAHALHPSTSTSPVVPINNPFLTVPHINGSLDHASAKKRWLRQAISEESDPCVPKVLSRPSSPVGVECLAPLKKRRLARASMSSEVSNTPPSTPNHVDIASSEMDLEAEDTHHNGGNNDISVQHNESNNTYAPAEHVHPNKRKWSVSEVSSTEEDLEDTYDYKHQRLRIVDSEPSKSEGEYSNRMDLDDSKDLSDTQDKFSSPPTSYTPRKSRWDQVDAPGPVVNNCISSPVKATDAIVLDYVRNPEHYAKLTGVPSFEAEKGAIYPDTELFQETQSMTESEPEIKGSVSEKDEPKKVKETIAANETDTSEQDMKIVNRENNVESSPKTPIQVKKKLSMEEYFKRKKEVPFEEKSVALNQTSSALNSMTNYEPNTSESFPSSGKEVSSPKSDGDPNIRETLQFSSTPTLAERKREELGKRLSKSFGIRVPDAETPHAEPPSTPVEKPPCPPSAPPPPPPPPLPYPASPRDNRDIREIMMEKHKLNGDMTGHHYSSSGSMTPSMNMPKQQQPITGRRLSVPTPAALKQSGMPPLPPHLSPSPQFSSSSTSNGIVKPSALNATSNGYGSSPYSHGGSSYNRHYRGATNGPANYSNHHHHHNHHHQHHNNLNHHHHQSRNLLTLSSVPSGGSSSASSGAIIGGVPVCNLIPPPPPPTNQGTSGSAFGKRFCGKKFFPSS